MNSVNYVQILFCLMINAVIVLGSLISYFEKYLPTFFVEVFRYGKFSYTGKSSLIKPIQIPKSWFRHFYVYSSMLLPAALSLAISVYCLDMKVPVWLVNLLDTTGGANRKPTVNQAQVLLALILMNMQCIRRFYDTQFISVFGKNSHMDLSHYLVGFIHYTGCVLAILIEAPVFANSIETSTLKFYDLKLSDYIFTIIFLWAFIHQYKVTVILANLRKNKKGEVVSQTYQLPKGDWFEYLSSPHSTAEIMMYFSLLVILWGNMTWFIVFCWVLSNQISTMLLSHWWYQETFKEFPVKRKVLIPYIY